MFTSFPDPSWADSDDRACLDWDLELFYPEKGVSARKAKAICRTCPFITECFEYALPVEEFGVWGGTTPEERKALRRKARIVLSTTVQ